MSVRFARFVFAAACIFLAAGCPTTVLLNPSSRATWPVVEQRARFELGCRQLDSHVALANGEPRRDRQGRSYYEYAIVGCQRRALYRAYFTPDSFSFTWPAPAQSQVDAANAAAEWTDEVELVGAINDVSPSAAPTPSADVSPAAASPPAPNDAAPAPAQR